MHQLSSTPTLMQIVSLVLAFALALPAFGAPFWGATDARPFETTSSELKPGDYTWAPEIAPAGPILVIISLEEQRGYVYRNGALIARTTVSTGKPGHATPTGVFVTTFKDADHHSNKYDNAPMPFTQRFTRDGVALHAGGLPGYPESHGCVHLPSEFARRLFDISPLGMTVVISGKPGEPDEYRHPSFLSPVTASGEPSDVTRLADEEQFRWQPENAPGGPLSLLLSRADARLVVLRNGIEVGRSRVRFADPARPLGSHVFVAKASAERVPSDMPTWTGVALNEHLADSQLELTHAQQGAVHLPHAFLQQLVPELTGGTTLMVTDEPILEQSTGKTLTVVTSSP